MIKRIHILGASGSGTTTLARELSQKINYKHFDTDNFFWVDTLVPFQEKRKVSDRIDLLKTALEHNEKWILSGSLCGWGDIFIPSFDLVIFLWLPMEIRLNRLLEREKLRYGENIKKDGNEYERHIEFMEWASKYDSGDLNIRSRKLHNKWLSELNCNILKIEGDIELEDKINQVIEYIENIEKQDINDV